MAGDTQRDVKCLIRLWLRQTEGDSLGAVSKREWNTPVRAAWCPLIYQALQAVDRHNALWFVSRDPFHLHQAELLRDYVSKLKTWIHQEEAEKCPDQK